MNSHVLTSEFFARDTLQVAQELLGKFLVHPQTSSGEKALCITEVEAYIGEDDLASHARVGRTKRTEPMYGQPGTAYVYIIYGMHWCFNVVTEEKDFPAAILIRAGVFLSNSNQENGENLNVSLRDAAQVKQVITGPGRLCSFLEIDASYNNQLLTSAQSLHFADRGVVVAAVHSGPRVGISRAVDTPWRFRASFA